MSAVRDCLFNIFAATVGRPRRRWEDNIKMDLQGVGCAVLDWIELEEDSDRWRAVVDGVMKLLVT